MQKQRWSNDRQEAWVTQDGTLIIKQRVDIPADGHPFYYSINTLLPVPEATKE